MKTIYRFLIGQILLLALTIQVAIANDENHPSFLPKKNMQKLEQLIGRWTVTNEMMSETDKKWQIISTSVVKYEWRQNAMLIAEIPEKSASNSFHMETYIAFDQYRNTYRKAAIDDIWGIMDIYEGNIINNSLVMTNLKSGTFFPVGEGNIWRAFKLEIELAHSKRVTMVYKSDDDGLHWEPAFRVTYVALN